MVRFPLVSSVSLPVSGFRLGRFLYWSLVRDHVGFASPATAALLPTGIVTGVVATLSYGFFGRIEKRLEPKSQRGLKWV